MGGVPRTEPMATWSLVCGIAGFVICGVVLGVAAIVLANNAQRKIAASTNSLGLISWRRTSSACAIASSCQRSFRSLTERF